MARPAVEPEALRAVDAARLIGVCRSKFYQMHSAGKTPLPVYYSPKCPRWVRSELLAWLAAGGPDRQTWVKLRKADKGVRP